MDGINAEGDSPNKIHSITGSPMPQGKEISITRAFLDVNHILVTIMARISPSPEWFMGIESIQLCVDGN